MKFKFLIFVFIFLAILSGIYSQAFGEFDSFLGYCNSVGYKSVSAECAAKFLETGDFKTFGAEIFQNPVISEVMINRKDLLEKYVGGIIQKDLTLLKGENFKLNENPLFNEKGILSLRNGEKFDLTKLSPGSKVEIFSDRIEVSIKENSKVSNLRDIAVGDSKIKLKPSEFFLDGEKIKIIDGNVFADKNGNLILGEGGDVFFSEKNVNIINKAKELLYLNAPAKNSVVFSENKILAKSNENGKYLLKFGTANELAVGGGENLEFDKLDFGDRTLKYSGTKYLEGEDVRDVQKALNSLDYSAGKEDASYGINTKNAVINFQKDYYDETGICVGGISGGKCIFDGVVGDKTKSALMEKFGSYSKLKSSSDANIFKNLDGNYFETDGKHVADFSDKIIANDKVGFSKIGVSTSNLKTEGNYYSEKEIKNIRDGMSGFDYDIKNPGENYKLTSKNVPSGVKIFVQSSDGKVLSGEAYVSFYNPENDADGGGLYSAVGPKLQSLLDKGIPVVAGSDRLGVPFGNALYELENPTNGKKIIVAVVDRFKDSTLKKYPERFFDLISYSGVPEKLGFSGDPKDSSTYGIQKVKVKYAGKISDL